MDDLTAFERQIRRVLGDMAGPEPRFDAREIVRPTSVTSPRWAVQPMFSTTKLAAAAVILALSGGFVLASEPPERWAAGGPSGAGDIAFVQAAHDRAPVESTMRARVILAVPVDGDAPTPLLDVPGERWGFTGGLFPDDPRNDRLAGPAVRWSPGGERMAFRLFNDVPGIYLLDRDGGDLRRLVELPRDAGTGMPFAAGLDWSPDGKRIAYTYPYGGLSSPIYTVDVDSGQVTRLGDTDPPSRPATFATRTVEWSPDGSRIAFARTEGTAGLPRSSELFVVNADGTGERQLTTGPEPYPQVRSVAWSPDGLSIAFVQDMGDAEQGAPERGVLRVVDADGSGLRTLTGPWRNHGCCYWVSTDEPLAWSPDGTSVAMVRVAGEDPDFHDAIVLVNADGSGERELMAGSWFDWSPDGSRLVVSDAGGIGPSETYSIHVIDVDGTDRRWLADGEYPDWSPVAGG